jgi:CBS domain containing-hemolysin-like protein
MVPRVDIVALDIDTALEDALNKIIGAGHSRIPVYQETIDTIVGILYAKDLLPALRDNQRALPIANLLRKVRFVPETLKVDALLKELRQTKVHIAIVVDEYGGTAGLVTIEDVMEEIFGDIQDEYDVEDPPIQMISDREMIVDARVSIDEISELTDLDIESEESDRIGGLVYEKLGRIPQVDDVVAVNGAVVKVVSVKGISPSKLHITFDHPPEINSPELLQKGKRFARSMNSNENDLLTELLAREAQRSKDTTNEPA